MVHRNNVRFPVFASMLDGFANSAFFEADKMISDLNKLLCRNGRDLEPLAGFHSHKPF